MAQEDYRKALRLGQKEFRSSVLKGTYPYLQALDEILEHTAVEYTEPLGVVNIPLASIVGTKTAGRKTAFAGNFMPLWMRTLNLPRNQTRCATRTCPWASGTPSRPTNT